MGEFQFSNPSAFLLLLALPLFAWVYVRRGFGAGGAVRFSDLGRVRRLPPTLSTRLRHSLFVLRMLAFVLLVAALARPQARLVTAPVTSEGVDIVLTMDLSTSMAAEDLAPRTTRIDVAKQVAKEFVAGRTFDSIGLVSFAKYATMRCPLTLHHALLEGFIDQLQTSRYIQEGMSGEVRAEDPDYDGTAIGSGLASALRLLRESKAKSKVVVLLTDGQNNAGIHPLDSAQAAKALEVTVYTVGVGSRGRAPIKIHNTMFGARYEQMDVDIDEETLKRIADLTGGQYYRAVDESTLRDIFREIDRREKTEIKEEAVRFRESFEGIALAALVFLLVEQVLAHTRFRTLP